MARRPRTVTRVDGKTVSVPDADEMLRRRIWIRELHSLGTPRSRIIESACREFGISPASVEYVLKGIRDDLRIESELTAPENRAAALDRLYNDLLNARSDLQSMRTAAVKNYPSINAHVNTVARIERLIAEFEGTLRPVKVDVGFTDMSEALQRALTSMSPDQIDAAVKEERERLRDGSALETHALPPAASPSHAPTADLASEAVPAQRSRRSSLPAARPPDPVADRAQGGAQSPSEQGRVLHGPNVEGGVGPRSISARVLT